MMLNKWEKRFVNLAHHIALWSKDPNTKIGAVVVQDSSKQILSTGYNGMARGVNDDVPERNSRVDGEKYYWYGHGERNAIYNAARYGISLRFSTIYLNCGMPCTGCAIAIIQAGIDRVVCKEGNPTGVANDKWDREAIRSKVMFEEAGVKTNYYDHYTSGICMWNTAISGHGFLDHKKANEETPKGKVSIERDSLGYNTDYPADSNDGDLTPAPNNED